MRSNVVKKQDRFPTSVGSFVVEHRAPTEREVELFIRFIAHGINEGQLEPVMNDFQHELRDGNYYRTFVLQANAIVVGRIHKSAHTMVVKSGYCSVYSTVDGVAHLKAGDIFPASAYSQKVVFGGDMDCILITCTPSDLTSLDHDLVEEDIVL